MSDSPKGSRIRLLLVDDHAILRQGLRCALELYSNIEVVGEASNGEEALACVPKVQPTVVVMDIVMPKMDGIAATRYIKAQYPQIAVVGLSADRKDYMTYSMQKAGAFEVVSKENAMTDLYNAIQGAVAASQPVLVMEETPVSTQAPDLSGTNEFMIKIQSVETPETNQEKDS